MELVFLSRKDLSVLDYAFVSNDFELVIDSVINQKSYFVCNKEIVIANIGDIVLLKNSLYSYIGIIDTIEIIDGLKQVKIQTNDFISLFDMKVQVSSYSGDIGIYIQDLIEENFIYTNDSLQNMSYLKVFKSTSSSCDLVYDTDTLLSLTELIETLTKSNGIRIDYELEIVSGVISYIVINITDVTKGLALRYDLDLINNLTISDSSSQTTNKVIYYPSSDNVNKSIVAYYLLKDGTITTNVLSDNRYSYVGVTSSYYTDADYDSLYTKAQEELLKSNLEHNISFSIKMNNKLIVPLNNLCIGDYVEFVSKDKVYQTMVTQLKFKGNYYECYVVLGEYRIKLTDKIKLLEKSRR